MHFGGLETNMKKVKVENAIGMVLAHDITRIIPGKFKGVGFKKGHIVEEKDIPELKKLGKNHIYVLNLSANKLHEDDAGLRIARAISGDRLHWTDPVEGKSSIISNVKGLVKVNPAVLLKINKLGEIIVSTTKNNFPCQEGQIIAATRIIPLTINIKKIERLELLAQNQHPVINVMPYRKLKVGAVVTGSELYEGIIKDEFDKYVGKKVNDYGSSVLKKILTPDNPGAIGNAVAQLKDLGCDLILTTGGLSVDPDDVTRQGVKQVGAEIIAYGAPVLPGAMFLYAKLEGIPILGLPACVFYYETTIFDLTFPRVLAGDEITKNEIAQMGHGGLCLNCNKCRFPVCPFGK
jgi:molybdenum cofactor synthesis domain-containing protein